MSLRKIKNILDEANAEADKENRAEAERMANLVVRWIIARKEVNEFRDKALSVDFSKIDNSYGNYNNSKLPDVTLIVHLSTNDHMTGSFQSRGDYSKYITLGIPSNIDNPDTFNVTYSEIRKYISNHIPEFTNVFVHEYLHYIDEKRYSSFSDNDKGDFKDYLSNPNEFNSFAQGIMSELGKIHNLPLNKFDLFLDSSREHIEFLDMYLNMASSKYVKKMTNRLYQYYKHLGGV